jgi:hypothetical protein
VVDAADPVLIVDESIWAWVLRSLDGVFDLQHLGTRWHYEAWISNLGWRICLGHPHLLLAALGRAAVDWA